MAERPAPPPFSVPANRGPAWASAILSAGTCAILGFVLAQSGAVLLLGRGLLEAAPRRVPPRIQLALNWADSVASPVPKAGRPGTPGGSRGSGTVDPRLLSLKRSAVPPVEDRDVLLPLPSREAEPTFAGDALLPKAIGGDGNPSGHGMGFGTGTGDGTGQGGRSGRKLAALTVSRAPREWGVMKKVTATYPPKALENHIEGYVAVQVTVDELGIPTDVQPIKGNAILMAECLRVMRLWRFERPATYGLSWPASFPVIYRFVITGN